MNTSSTHINDQQQTENGREPLILIEDVHKSFGDNHVIRGFYLQLFENENLVIVENPVQVNRFCSSASSDWKKWIPGT
jgi:hypothetical protein